MLSITKVQSSGKTTDYFAKDDYYASNDPNHQKFSNWYGKGAEELGLEGHITNESFRNVLEGNLPNGQKIGLKKSSQNVHDAGRDLTFSAPKSVSIMALVYDDKRLIEAHSQAIKNTLDEIEKNYFKTRVKKGGEISLESTGKLVAGIFQHELSRALDPQLHSHAIVANATCDENGKWRSGHFDEIYDNKNFLGLIYRAELASLVKELGYEITHTGKDCFFELNAVPKTLLDLFSSRSKKIREVAGQNASQKELEKITLKTREDKKIREHEHNLGEEWREKAVQFLAKKSIKSSIPEIPVILDVDSTKNNSKKATLELANQAVDFAIKHLSERKTVFSKRELASTALNDILSKATYSDIEKSINKFVEKQELLPTKKVGLERNTFTTSELLNKENAIIDLMVRGKKQHHPIVKDLTKYSEILSGLNDGQKRSAELILSSKDMVTGVQGYAGVGKTYMLNSVNKIAVTEGYELIGLSPTGVATRHLSKEAGINSMTLQRFLSQYDGVAVGRGTKQGRLEMQQDFKNKIVIVDEASMISTTQMKNLLTISKELNFKLVLVGDRKQLDSVEAGVPFFELQRNGMALAEMREILRQKNLELKTAVYSTINRKIDKAFEELAYDIVVTKDVTNKAASQFMAMNDEMRKATMILAPANEIREDVNKQIADLLYKERMQQSSAQIKDQNYTQEIYQNKNLTEAEKTRSYRFQAGDVLFFSKDRKYIGVKKGAYHEVVKVEPEKNLITIKTGLLTTKTFNPIGLKGKAEKIYFEVFEKSERIFRVEDKIAFSRSIPELKIINSDGATITEIGKSKISLKLDNGANIKIKKSAVEAKHIDHSYAVTAHKAQGLSCKNVIAICESYRKKLTTQKNFYVEISRAQERAIIITDDKEKTIEQLKQNTGIEISAREHQDILSLRAQEKIKSENQETATQKIIAEERKPSVPEKQIAVDEIISADSHKDNKAKPPHRKSHVALLSESEIKEHFLEAIKSGMKLDEKDVNSAIDQSFEKPSTKIRFGEKKEYEICWYKEAGYVKNYKTGEIIKWGVNSIKFGDVKPEFKKLSAEELKLRQEQKNKERDQLEKQKTAEEKEATEKAKKYFESFFKPSILNTSSNKYLAKKGINHKIIDGIRFTKDDKLVVPVHDANGEIHSLQFIDQDGTKKFLTGGKKQGNFFMIDQDKVKDSKTIYLAEGFATAATINIATDKPVAVSFDAGNIEHVLKNLKTTHPDKEFIIAADNDLWKEHNVGREKAELAAQKHGAKIILPKFTLAHKDEMPTDFNDLHKLSGIHEVQRQIESHQIVHEHHHDLQI
jgi:conjugative relaxase-like TrwC/TraI family protein